MYLLCKEMLRLFQCHVRFIPSYKGSPRSRRELLRKKKTDVKRRRNDETKHSLQLQGLQGVIDLKRCYQGLPNRRSREVSGIFHGTKWWQLSGCFLGVVDWIYLFPVEFFVGNQIWRTTLPDCHPVKLGISNYICMYITIYKYGELYVHIFVTFMSYNYRCIFWFHLISHVHTKISQSF